MSMKNRKNVFRLMLVFAFWLMYAFANAQDLPPIQTDRPDQTECPFIVPQNYFQVESGFAYEKPISGSRQISHPSVLAKYGVNPRFELRYETSLSSFSDSASAGTGFSPQTIGFKVRLMEEKGILPLCSFIAHLDLPGIASKEFRSPYFAPSFRFTMQHTLTEKICLAYNLGAEWKGDDPHPVFLYTLTTGFSLTEKAGAYIEAYGFSQKGFSPDHRADGGFTYLITNNMMCDLSGGVGLSRNSPRYFVAAGLSFRIRTKSK